MATASKTLLLLAALASCRDPGRHFCQAEGCQGAVVTARWDVRAPRPLDILFVIDPQALARGGERVRGGLVQLAREIPKSPRPFDLHIAVVSSVLDPAGEPVSLLSGTCAPKGAAFLTVSHQACGVPPNFDRPLEEALSCLAAAPGGTNQPLQVTRRLLGDPAQRPGPFRDFIRADAVHLLVIVSTRDDASLEPAAEPAALAAFLDAVPPGRPGALLISVLAPAPAADGGAPCALAAGESLAGRLLALVDARADTASYFDLCLPDWNVAFAAGLTSISIGSLTCVPAGVRDRDPSTPGVQPDCLVRQLTAGPAGSQTDAVPGCTAGQRPCVAYRPEVACTSETLLVVERDCYPPAGTQLELTCAQQ
jgi:hypothetical protein